MPTRLAKTFDHKEEYTGKLMAATREGEHPRDQANLETDRLMLEHHLYDWGKEVIFTNSAAEIFTVYAGERRARPVCKRLKDIDSDVSGKSLQRPAATTGWLRCRCKPRARLS
jgi:hypothetical protein